MFKYLNSLLDLHFLFTSLVEAGKLTKDYILDIKYLVLYQQQQNNA